ncbi:hypothetical protein NGB36_26160 [Streptomyces sp. RB6PN25]|uniref:ATPase AAA-type core domain-containing protein n=1 Tax=Streptomyces humicola TaxID=2953240 RepID=A0ABT1Q232_9ACTN|nr:hypothetical protein [Streptomyces humicola]MCQ4083976.1 hypothetical protein [Streptomyces humicola]
MAPTASTRDRPCSRAAALVHDPQVLLLDEPSSGLDPLAVDTMSAVLRERAEQGAPVLFSSHQLDLVERLCDRIGIVRSGSMVARGSVEELRARGGEGLYIEIDGAPRDWAQALRGIDSFRSQGRGTLVRVTTAATRASSYGTSLLWADCASSGDNRPRSPSCSVRT